MTTEREMAIAIATEIGKQVPVRQVYDDAASPAMRQVGATFEDVVKCIRLVGFPIQWLSLQQDRFRAYLERAKAQIPNEERILPHQMILGPILEGIKYHTFDNELSDMFENLLSSSMDITRFNLVHPAFAKILSRITPDEAKLIRHLSKETLKFGFEPTDEPYIFSVYVIPPDNILEFKDGMQLYVDNLRSLGLLEFQSPEKNVFDMRKNFVKLSSLGKRLVDACKPRNSEGPADPAVNRTTA